jgi:hypothetical protein
MGSVFLLITAFNIIAIPAIIYFHVVGECNLLLKMIGTAREFCTYFTNPFANLLYINLLFFVLALLIYANSQVEPSQSKPHFPKKH